MEASQRRHTTVPTTLQPVSISESVTGRRARSVSDVATSSTRRASTTLDVVATGSGFTKAIGLFPKRNPSLAISVQSASNSALNHFHGEATTISEASDEEIDTCKMKDFVEFRKNLTRAQSKGILPWQRLAKATRRRILESMIRLQAIESTMRVELKMKPDDYMVKRLRICGEYIKLHEETLMKMSKPTRKHHGRKKDAEVVVNRKKASVPVPSLPGTHSDRVVDVTITTTPSKLEHMDTKAMKEKARDKRHVPRTRLRHILPLPSMEKWAEFLQ